MILEVRELGVRVGDFVLEDFSITVQAGECVALMGPSGCGKTTVVETICGLRKDGVVGRIFMEGREVTDLPPGARGIGLVPQEIVLFPGMTVRENLEFGPRMRGWRTPEIRQRGEELAEGLALTGLLERMPESLSGGQARRVALGRALAARPRLLCFDEALSGLDAERHGKTLALVRRMIREEGVAALHVTHSHGEARALADRVVKM